MTRQVRRLTLPTGRFFDLPVELSGPSLQGHQVSSLGDRVKVLRGLVWGTASRRPDGSKGSLRDPLMRNIGLLVTNGCPPRKDMCELEAVFDFIVQNVRYTGDIAFKDTFQSALRTLQFGGGDCFPEGTLFVTRDGLESVERLEEGDEIHDGATWVPVLKTWNRGPKTIFRVGLDNGKSLRLSDSHKILRVPMGYGYAEAEEIRMADVRIGDNLLRPQRVENASKPWAKVESITVEGIEVPSYDIMTSSGRVYLPAADVITRQCDDHAVCGAVLAMENGYQTKFRITSNTGATWDHIYLMAGVPKHRPVQWVALDTTLGQRKFARQPGSAKHRDFVVGEG